MTHPEFRFGHHGGRPLITPAAVLAAVREQLGANEEFDLGVPRLIFCTWTNGFYRPLAERLKGSELPGWWYGERVPLRVATVNDNRVGVVLLPVGAPGTVMVMEEMIVAGARHFIGVGGCGGLQTSSPGGTCFVVSEAWRDEGTSLHYLPLHAPTTVPDASLTAALENVLAQANLSPRRGAVWTTDAPFRELSGTVERFRAEGVIGVDMEASAMFALGSCREVPVASVMVVADVLSDPWEPNLRNSRVGQTSEDVCQALVDSIEELMPKSAGR